MLEFLNSGLLVRQQRNDRCGRCSGSVVGHQVRDREVVLMAKAGDDRNRKAGEIAAQPFVVKDGEVFAAATTTCQHECFESECIGLLRQTIQHTADAILHCSLDGDGHHQQARHRPALPGGAQHVSKGRAGNAGQHSDGLWTMR